MRYYYPSRQQSQPSLAINHAGPHILSRLFSTRHISSPSRSNAPPIGCFLTRRHPGLWDVGCISASHLSQRMHQAAPPPNHLHRAPCAPKWIQRLHKPQSSTPVGQRTRPQRINCLYNCGHIPLSCQRVLTHLTYRSRNGPLRKLPEHLTSLRLAYASALHQADLLPGPCA